VVERFLDSEENNKKIGFLCPSSRIQPPKGRKNSNGLAIWLIGSIANLKDCDFLYKGQRPTGAGLC
jgi:hypothetical protein